MKISEMPLRGSSCSTQGQTDPKRENPQKHPFRRVEDDSKPTLQDPILRSDPTETEEAMLLLPPFPMVQPSSRSNRRLNCVLIISLIN
ncbi:hypothetical protein SAY87_012178 [Trapa incisa]|uniref:Uncharacterized protein n=1 Tax=Trapa incisa TaxID=236973 RepID=A0AAN7JBZ0_9MYRT|nr:hypothetical protein SAY87_012178 [Trapa incisa]